LFWITDLVNAGISIFGCIKDYFRNKPQLTHTVHMYSWFFFNKQLSKRCLVGMSQTAIFMIIRLLTLSVNIFLCNWACALMSESLFQIRKGFSWFLIKFVLKMNSRKKGTGSEVNITLTMIWCQIVIQLVHMPKFYGGTVWFFTSFWHWQLFIKKISLYIVWLEGSADILTWGSTC
jgi:hypothetical protein